MTDTGALVLPESWHEHVHPRRGGTVTRPFTPDPEARDRTGRITAESRGRLTALLAAVSTPEPIRAAAARWLAGEPDPLGAGTVAAILDGPEAAAWADVWIQEHGLRFATLAAVETVALMIVNDMALGWRYYPEADSGIRHRLPDDPVDGSPLGLRALLRVRAALAVAPDDEFTRVAAALEPYRAGERYARAACAVVTARPDWVAQDMTGAECPMLLYAASTPEQVAALTPTVDLVHGDVGRDLFVTIADGVGAAAGPALLEWFDEGSWEYTARGTDQRLLAVLAAMPDDEVMRGLLARSGRRIVRTALLAAAERFPARALRILAEAGDDLLRAHVVKHAGLVGRVLPLLSPAAAARVRAITAAWDDVVLAPLTALPPVLADPPWRHRRTAAEPPVITGLRCTDAPAVSWLPGERQEWAQTWLTFHNKPGTDWAALAASVLSGGDGGRWSDPARLFLTGPEEVARPAIIRWLPKTDLDSAEWLRVAAARFETDALPALLSLARATPPEFGPHLLPFTSPPVATVMADWSARLKSMRRTARKWLLRHPEAAARALIPAALGKIGTTPRRQAERALLLLHTNGRTDQINTAAITYGPEAAAAVTALLTADPLRALPARMPSAPGWAAPGVLPPVRLRDGSGALPAEAVGTLILMLILSRPDEPYAGLDLVREAVEPADLAEFGWALFEQWQTAGASGKDGWAYDTLALTGDDETVRRLTPLILTWPTVGLHARALAGLSVLTGIGTDQALLHLHRVSQRARSTPLRKAATARITEIADELGLTAEQLADRLLPDFGLDAAGGMRLDYGPRQFVVGFDEQLRPFVTDADGKRLKTLPKPGARDDTALSEAAYRRFGVLKREVRKVSAEQVHRLERAMADGRQWTGAEFRRLFADHPLLWHIGRRLVWFSAGSGTALRIAEDRTFAGADDDPVPVTDGEMIGVAHPVRLGAETARWAEVFADYEILQPFPQLGRPVFTLTDAERSAGRLTRFEGITVPTTKVLTLDRRGWSRHEADDNGAQRAFDRLAGPGRVLTVHLDPGIVGQAGFDAEQKLLAVYLHDGTVDPWYLDDEKTLPLGDLDPVSASEILRDLTDVTT